LSDNAQYGNSFAADYLGAISFFSMDELRISSWLETEPKPRQFILQRFMPVGKTGMVVAPGGTGKSQLLLQLAMSVAAGIPLFGRYEVESPGGVLAFFTEDDTEELHRRFSNAVNVMAFL
jgi:RecA-family ATPase